MSAERKPSPAPRRREDEQRTAQHPGDAGTLDRDDHRRSPVERRDWHGEGVVGDQHTD
jgi:hypothetical protein